MKFLQLSVIACLSMSNVALAQSVAIKKAWDAVETQLKKEMETLKTACGSAITVTPTKASWTSLELIEGNAGWCSTVASSLADMCADADYKAAIAKDIKKLACVYDAKLETSSDANYGNKYTLKGGTLEFRYNKDSANLSDKLKEFLKKTL